MNIQDWGAIGELLGSIVVLITLVYLAIQTKLNRKATQAHLQWTRANASRELSMLWTSSAEPAELIKEFGTDEKDFPVGKEFNPRLFRYINMNRSIMELHQAFYLTSQTKTDKELAIARVDAQMRIPGFRSSWPTLKNTGTFYPEFIDLVEDAINAFDPTAESQ